MARSRPRPTASATRRCPVPASTLKTTSPPTRSAIQPGASAGRRKAGLPPRRRLVAAADGRAGRDELEALRPRDRQARRVRVDADEAARLQLDLLASDPHPAGPADDEVHLLLPL